MPERTLKGGHRGQSLEMNRKNLQNLLLHKDLEAIKDGISNVLERNTGKPSPKLCKARTWS